MPSIYLSPSTQEFNKYLNGGSEEEYMNLIANYMEPYLVSSGISFKRNTPDMTAASSIRESNSGNYDLHLALHSNASPDFIAGKQRGSDVYYYPRSVYGKSAADTIAENLKKIYPEPALVKALPTTSIGEVRRTKAPSVLIELGYHDNAEDEKWIKNNLEVIAVNLVQSLAQYFGIPFVEPVEPVTGTVVTRGGELNLRSYPSFESEVITKIPVGSQVSVVGGYGDWYTVIYDNKLGFAYSSYIRI